MAQQTHLYIVICTIGTSQNLDVLEDVPSVSIYITDVLSHNWTGEKDDLDYLIALKQVSIRSLFLSGGTTKIQFSNMTITCSHIIH